MNYGPLWIDLEGTTVSASEHAILQHPLVGGVVLFTKNFTSKQQLSALIENARGIAGKELLFAVDHEGGRVWRFNSEFTRPISAEKFGAMYQRDQENALKEIHDAGVVIAAELTDCDVDLTFAPVLDLDFGVSNVINERSYGRDPEVVIACARAFIAGLRSHGVAAVGKHFPGHGGCSVDSHFAQAIDERTIAELESNDILPYKALAKELAGVMPAHVLYPNVDKNMPCFSKFWLQDILRGQLGFQGTIVSDCISMQGSGYGDNMSEGITKALEAGCDMVIFTQATRDHAKLPRIDVIKILQDISYMPSADQCERIHGLSMDRQTVKSD